ncbi:MAG: gamma-glutamyl-gamma-aminobutyrate hydrolase family protein [Candidatus Pacearchaeota archaeon]|jgi:GMP synthase (glutamine-hydrolysing)
MKKNILIINISNQKLHYFEFVKPIEDILNANKIRFLTKHYKKLNARDVRNFSHIIISGTSLKDNEFVKEINSFKWILLEKKPILGICGGMQIIGLVYEQERRDREGDIKKDFSNILKKKTEIGFFMENFKKEFLGIIGDKEVYHLHNYYFDFNLLNDFEIFSESLDKTIPQAIKHKDKPLYGVLFHPEVRGKDLIERFCFI